MGFPPGTHRVADFATALLTVLVLFSSSLGQTGKASGKPAKSAGISEPEASISGAVTNGLYRNAAFGFTYKIPFGWADRTKEMSDESTEDSNAPKKSIVLLAVFERPPEASGGSINSAVVVAAEAASSYPGLQNAEQYFGPLTELTKSKGLKVVNEPYDYSVGARQVVRGDFSKPLADLIMHQSTLVIMEKSYVVSFTFIGGTEDEVDGLIESLSFGRKEPPSPHK
jgi:hypothetical protein